MFVTAWPISFNFVWVWVGSVLAILKKCHWSASSFCLFDAVTAARKAHFIPRTVNSVLHSSSHCLTSPMPTESIWLPVWQPLAVFCLLFTASAGCEKQQLNECELSLNLSSVYLQDWRRLNVPPGYWSCHLIDLTFHPALCEPSAWWSYDLIRSARASLPTRCVWRTSFYALHSHLFAPHQRSQRWPSISPGLCSPLLQCYLVAPTCKGVQIFTSKTFEAQAADFYCTAIIISPSWISNLHLRRWSSDARSDAHWAKKNADTPKALWVGACLNAAQITIHK